ncbi:MAG TPA: CHRD domain-containing protein, partial [Chitinophagaceae bacterium]|nr:CHRD domain-containing protein [Chitinophagaceae bacterium]
SGTASGAQEVPAVTTNATANLTGSYNETSNQLTYSITWTGLSGDATMAHFHGPAMAGQVAPPLITLNIVTNGTNGTAAGTVNIVDSVEQFFKEGKMYYNIHTTANQPGEIRSQVTLQR